MFSVVTEPVHEGWTILLWLFPVRWTKEFNVPKYKVNYKKSDMEDLKLAYQILQRAYCVLSTIDNEQDYMFLFNSSWTEQCPTNTNGNTAIVGCVEYNAVCFDVFCLFQVPEQDSGHFDNRSNCGKA